MGETRLAEAGTMKPGSYMIVDGAACVVKNVQTSKTGKHGSAKCRIEAMGIVDNQKRIGLYPAHDNVEVPIIEKKSAQVLSIHGTTANIMDNENYETFDIAIPEDMKDQIKEGSQVVYWTVMDQKIIKQAK